MLLMAFRCSNTNTDFVRYFYLFCCAYTMGEGTLITQVEHVANPTSHPHPRGIKARFGAEAAASWTCSAHAGVF